MDIFNVLALLGGLALFLYGMETMGTGLRILSGGRMEQILEQLTNTLLKGVLLGLVVTAVIQSSSATTVMVVALVNAGVMQLKQAVGVIMGANIGTTVTSWLLSLSGIESSNTFVKLLKPESFTPILAVIAIFILMSSKNDRKRSIATILIGFSILMFGMSTMSSSVSSLKDVPEFTQLFVLFSNPIIGMLVGAILTAVIQSSSASVGILQALCATGAITFASTIPIIMGQNIGTCFTAILSSIGTSKNAKRTAMIHLSFNVIGTILFMLLFYSINAIHPFPFLNDPVKPYSIAIVHTIFNILSTILLLPFSNVLVKLAHFLIPTKKGEVEITLDPVEEDLKRLAPHFLEQPGFAVEQAYATMTSMARQSYKAIDMALNLVEDYSDEMFDLVCRQENQIDRYEEALNKYLIQITAAKLNDRDNRKLTIMIHSLHDFERIADHAINIGEQAGKKNDATFEFSKVAMMDFYLFSAALRDIIQRTVEAFSNLDVERAFTIEPLEQRIDDLDQEFNNRHISRLRQGICSAELGIIISDLYNNMERVADHCSNIGECIVQYGNRNFKAYEYDSELYKSHNNFDRYYNIFAEKYAIYPTMDEALGEDHSEYYDQLPETTTASATSITND